jgi:hypothetical protein
MVPLQIQPQWSAYRQSRTLKMEVKMVTGIPNTLKQTPLHQVLPSARGSSCCNVVYSSYPSPHEKIPKLLPRNAHKKEPSPIRTIPSAMDFHHINHNWLVGLSRMRITTGYESEESLIT